jgi:hypothetical protein
MPRRSYRVAPRRASVKVEGRNPFEAERRARQEHPHLAGEDLIVVAANLAWERDSEPRGRSHAERLRDLTEQAEASGA